LVVDLAEQVGDQVQPRAPLVVRSLATDRKCLTRRAEPHDAFDTGPVVLAAVENDDFPRRSSSTWSFFRCSSYTLLFMASRHRPPLCWRARLATRGWTG